jgi:asparagine synthase (glutamine-hydrolysing)
MTSPKAWAQLTDPMQRLMFLEQVTLLPDDILVKVDRATMAVGLESRLPFLDPDVVELAWRLPMSHKVRGGQGKWALRQLLHRHVPPELVTRPKMGFSVPLGEWLRGPLRGWAEELLNERRLRAEGYLEPGPVRSMWQDHRDGRRDAGLYLWEVLMFEAWLDHHQRPPVATFPSRDCQRP